MCATALPRYFKPAEKLNYEQTEVTMDLLARSTMNQTIGHKPPEEMIEILQLLS